MSMKIGKRALRGRRGRRAVFRRARTTRIESVSVVDGMCVFSRALRRRCVASPPRFPVPVKIHIIPEFYQWEGAGVQSRTGWLRDDVGGVKFAARAHINLIRHNVKIQTCVISLDPSTVSLFVSSSCHRSIGLRQTRFKNRNGVSTYRVACLANGSTSKHTVTRYAPRTSSLAKLVPARSPAPRHCASPRARSGL